MHTTTVVIGSGRVGRTVAARLSGARLYGHGQQADLDDCRRLLIATPDAEIKGVCQALAPRLDAEASVIHFSGATSVHALDAAPGPTACVHPMQTVWPELGRDQLEGAYAAVTGDAAVGDALARAAGHDPVPAGRRPQAALPRGLDLRLQLRGHDHAGRDRPAGAGRASIASWRCTPCARCRTGRWTWPAADPPGRSHEATRPPSPRTWRRSAPSCSPSTVRSAEPHCRWSIPRPPTPFASCCEHRPRPHHGCAPRRPSRPAAHRPGRERARGDEPVREPHPVRPRRGLPPLSPR